MLKWFIIPSRISSLSNCKSNIEMQIKNQINGTNARIFLHGNLSSIFYLRINQMLISTSKTATVNKSTPKTLSLAKTTEKTRNKNDQTFASNDGPETDEKKRTEIMQLNDVLEKLLKRIRKIKNTNVDWDDLGRATKRCDLLVKQALKIGNELCILTGESPTGEGIKFTGTKYLQFNQELEKFVNEIYPNGAALSDVLRILDHCNKKYNYRMEKAEQARVGEGFYVIILLVQLDLIVSIKMNRTNNDYSSYYSSTCPF